MRCCTPTSGHHIVRTDKNPPQFQSEIETTCRDLSIVIVAYIESMRNMSLSAGSEIGNFEHTKVRV